MSGQPGWLFRSRSRRGSGPARAARARAALVVCAALPAPLLLASAPALAAGRQIPVGMYNVNNQVMNSSSYLYALRFVPDRDTSLHRFISGFNIEGTDYLGGREGYADGDGGVVLARLVEVRENGEPDLSRVLASERVEIVKRYIESKAAYGAPGLNQLLHFNMGGVQLRADRMYAMVYQNVAASPGTNWFSENSPTVKESEAGPNATNTVDPGAQGAIAGLDPREAVGWSKDSGQGWVWGRRAGEGPTKGSYAGSATSDDGTRLPWYGLQTSATAAPQASQPYYAYKETGSYTLRLSSAPRAVTLTKAGGYAPVGQSVGVVTVRNLQTGATAKTSSLGSGIATGALDPAVKVEAGQSYEISNSGTVLKAEGDSFIVSTFKVGTGAFPFQTVGYGNDRAELFALPHPWYAADGASTPPPTSPTPPTPTPPPTPSPSSPTPAPSSPTPASGKRTPPTPRTPAPSSRIRLDVGVTPGGQRVLTARGEVKGKTSGVVQLTTLRAPRNGGRFRRVSKRQAKLKAGRFKVNVSRFRRGRWRVQAALKGTSSSLGQQQRRLDRGKKGSGRAPAPAAGGQKAPPDVTTGGGSRVEGPQSPSEAVAGDSSFAPPLAPGQLPGGGYLRPGAPAPRGAVSSVQGMLAVAGYASPATGVFDTRTAAAVRRFQLARGLLVDGVVGRQTMSALREAVGDGN